jgi:glutamine amidotransferase
MIAIIDYDVGNVNSVANMFKRLGYRAIVTRDPIEIANSNRIVLPGNGSFDTCVRNLRRTGLVPLLEEQVLAAKTPLLGICVGAQMLGKASQEGVEVGLGWIDMESVRFDSTAGLPIPHMGWAHVAATERLDFPAIGLESGARFYFVHSYYMKPAHRADVWLEADYGETFVAAVRRGNILGVQFHPEKSHKFGKHLLSEFARLGT